MILASATVAFCALLLRKGEKPMYSYIGSVKGSLMEEDELLCKAVYFGNTRSVIFLVKNGADIHCQKDRPLKLAHEYSRTNIILYLESLQ